jgi:hypothetical protein
VSVSDRRCRPTVAVEYKVTIACCGGPGYRAGLQILQGKPNYLLLAQLRDPEGQTIRIMQFFPEVKSSGNGKLVPNPRICIDKSAPAVISIRTILAGRGLKSCQHPGNSEFA